MLRVLLDGAESVVAWWNRGFCAWAVDVWELCPDEVQHARSVSVHLARLAHWWIRCIVYKVNPTTHSFCLPRANTTASFVA